MSVRQKRSLTAQEKAGLEIVKNFERAITENRLTITLSCSREAAALIGSMDGQRFRVMKVDFIPSKQHYAVTFDLPNYRKYMSFILPYCGLRLDLDGGLTTADNLVISADHYLLREERPHEC